MNNGPIDRSCRCDHRRSGFPPAALTLVLFALAALATPSRADDWPQFRGPNSSGVSTTTKPLPVTFSNTENVRWSASVGEGVGGAVVAAGRVFVSGMTAKETVSLFAFDVAAGENGTVVVLKNGPDYEELVVNDVAGSIVATPAIADGALFIRTRDRLLCIAP